MILVVTNERDLTSDFVVLELQRRGLRFWRLNSERLPEAKVSFDPRLGEDGWKVALDGQAIELSQVRAAYFRRPGQPAVSPNVKADAARRYCQTEWTAVLQSALASLGKRWFNNPLAIMAAENKPRQLAAAIRLGFSVPDTLISNDWKEAKAFVSAGPTVVKPVREALIEQEGDESVIFTTRLAALNENDVQSVAVSPVIFQREIRKLSDIRATVVTDTVLAAEILSQQYEETSVDWRRGGRLGVDHRPHVLPTDMERKCIEIVRSLDLQFGAVDLILDERGQYWFLEVNPNGQWAWIENRTGMPITKAIVDELQRIAA